MYLETNGAGWLDATLLLLRPTLNGLLLALRLGTVEKKKAFRTTKKLGIR